MNIRNVHKDVCIIRISNPCVHLSSFPCTSNWKWTYSSHKLQLIKNCILMAGIFLMQSCPNKLCTFHEWFDVLHLNSVFQIRLKIIEHHQMQLSATILVTKQNLYLYGIKCDIMLNYFTNHFMLPLRICFYNLQINQYLWAFFVVRLAQYLICNRCFVLKQSKLLI